MHSQLERLDRFAGRVTNRLIDRIHGPTINVPSDAPVVSFTFDDVPDSALTHGATILERYGARGTFYISGGLVGRKEASRTLIDVDGCRELYARGHELGSHTYAHPNLRHLHGHELRDDLERNRAFLTDIMDGKSPTNFAYPYNASSFRARPLLAQNFRSARGGFRGINRGIVDRSYLHGFALQHPEESVLALRDTVDELLANPGWLIFFAHDIAEHPTPFGCTASAFETLVKYVHDLGCTVLTVDAAMDRFEAAA